MASTRLRSTFRALNVFLHSSHLPHTRQSCYSKLASLTKPAEDQVNAFVSYDNLLSSNEPKYTGPLSGISVAVKDNICTKQFKTTCSSAMLQDFRPPYDATVVRLLHESGARVVGKTNCDEFGMGSFNVHSIHGPVMNPYHPPELPGHEHRSAGGSSGGSAAAAASGTCHIAIGTDTGGSVRLPAAYCGISGFKPSYGLISRWGVVSYADSLDCVGILSKDVTNIQLAFDVLSKFDPKDPTSASEEVRRKASQLSEERSPAKDDLSDLVIGIPQEYFPEELDDSAITPLRTVVARLKSDTGAKVIPVSLPSTPYALSAYYVIASAEASSNLARYSGIHYGLRVAPPPEADKKRVSDVYSYTRSEGFGHEVQKRILLGTYALTADAFDNYFLQAQTVRNLVKADFDRVFRSTNPLAPIRHSGGDLSGARVDVLLHPSAVRTAPKLSEIKEMDRLEAYVQDVLTVPASLAGLPALSVPAGEAGEADDGWPVGVSIVGQWGHDNLVLKIGDAMQGIIEA